MFSTSDSSRASLYVLGMFVQVVMHGTGIGIPILVIWMLHNNVAVILFNTIMMYMYINRPS